MFNNSNDESIRGLMLLKLFTRKLQRTLMMMTSRGGGQNLQKRSTGTGEFEEDEQGMKVVPNDVKRGQFAVTATKGGKPKRFIVELEDLNDPDFINLLEQAEEKFGFQQEGVLEVPCHPEELQKVLRGGKIRRASTEW
ncbi:Auxin-responsive protein SAUR32 [Linum perenne]